MSDDAHRPLTEEERARAQQARTRGRLCATCGRSLAEGESVWMERLYVGPDYTGMGAIYWQAPVGRECALASSLAESDGHEPPLCVGCGRGVFHLSADARRRSVRCSKWCGRRYRHAPAEKGAPS